MAQVQRGVLDANKFASNFIGEAAVCFSKDAKWYSGAGNFVTGVVAWLWYRNSIIYFISDK